jgi:PEP-CTERM motif
MQLQNKEAKMRLNRTTVAAAVLAGVALLTPAIPASADPIVWTGPSMTFTKADFADWMLSANQDRLTDNVWLTRGATLPLFNIAAEPFYEGGSPSDTEWAFGPTQPGNPGPISASNHANLVFDNFILSLERAVGRNVVAYGPGVLHLISDDIYLDIRFTSWTQESGGGFSYIRSTPDQSPVPEPATATLLLVGGAVAVAVRRRKQHRGS